MSYRWRRYVPVRRRRAIADRGMRDLRKQGLDVQPIVIDGSRIAKSFWGEAWCLHLESHGDYANRLPRGRTYVRNGSVCHLAISKGVIEAKVMGSELYEVRVQIAPLPKKRWNEVKRRCAGQIGSILELLQGKLSKKVMAVVTHGKKGLFPAAKEIVLGCSCPDWAIMCKHVAAVLYGVGARLDERPELLFLLRGVDHTELVDAELSFEGGDGTRSGVRSSRMKEAVTGLSEIFDIEFIEPAPRPSRKAKKGVQALTGDFVRKHRARLQLTQAEFAALVGITATTISVWERRGTLSPRPQSAKALRATARLSKKAAWARLED